MGRTGARALVAVVFVCALGAARSAAAQAPPGEGWVVLPVDEYRTLRERTLAPAAPPSSGVDATLTRVDYDLRLEGDSILGRAILTMDVLRDGWARVQIPTGLMARDAQLNGQPVSLVEGPPPYVLLTRAGRAVLTLDIAVPQSSAGGADSITLPASPSPIAHVAFRLPRTGIDLTVSGGFTAERTEDAGETRWSIFGRPNQPLALSWKRKVDDRRAGQPLRFRARVTQLVGLGEDAAQVSASIRLDVQQGVAPDVLVALPSDLVVNQVNGATVSDWRMTPDGLRVTLLEPATSDAAFVIQAEARVLREGTLAIPLIRVPAAERETGGVAVDVIGAGEIAGRQIRNIEPGDPSDLGDIVAGRESPSMIAFRLRPVAGSETRALNVAVVRYTPQAVLIANIEEARYRILAAEDGHLLVEALYAVRNNQRSFLKIALPAGATVWSAAVAGRPVRPGVAEANALLLPLQKGRVGEEAPTFVVSVVYVQNTSDWPARGQARVELPALDLPVSRTGLRLHFSPRFAVTPVAGAFRPETDNGPSAEALRRPVAPVPVAAATSPANARQRQVISGEEIRDLPSARQLSELYALVPGVAVANAHTAGSDLQALVDRYQKDTSGRSVVGSLPVRVAFPVVGPSVFLASELSAEGRGGVIDFQVKRTK